MAKNKTPDDAAKKPEENELVARVDAMMNPQPTKPNTVPSGEQAPAIKPAEPKHPEIDIFKDLKTAPEVSPALLKKIGIHNDKKSASAEKPEAAAEPAPAEVPAAKPIIVKHEAKTITPLAAPEADTEPESEKPVGEPAPDEETEIIMSSERAPEEPAVPDSELDETVPRDAPISEHMKKVKDEEPYDDAKTNKAVDDIVANEADEILAAEDLLKHAGRTAPAVAAAKKPKRKIDWKSKFASLKSKKGLFAAAIVVTVLIFAVPFSRYAVLGLAIKKSVTVRVVDSKTAAPVSDAEVILGGVSAKTNGLGEAKLRSAPGNKTLEIRKQYYRDYRAKQFIGLSGQPAVSAKLAATGRLVPVIVKDKVSGKPVVGAVISVLKTTAKTDFGGRAVIVLPADKQAYEANISGKGFNTVKTSIAVTDKQVAQNSFELTPAGKIVFLSNQGGTIDVVKANLDGSGRQTVLEGTGREDARSTSLLASRDWRYAVLKARRDTAQPALYLIDTATNKVTPFETGPAEYELVGWQEHHFVYDAVYTAKSRWQTSREVLKSYNAERGEANLLDQNQAEGNGTAYGYQSFYNFYLLDGLVAYTTQWATYDLDGTFKLTNKNATIRSTTAGGQNKKDHQSFPADTFSYLQAVRHEPQALYYGVTDTNGKTLYYEFKDKAVAQKNTIDAGAFNRLYPTYLASPDGKRTFWSELRDGKTTLLLGDTDAKNKKVIASLNEYAPYGWHSDKYLLVSKSGSELFIMPASGLEPGRQPLKLTDYYKPTQTPVGYGYGGL